MLEFENSFARLPKEFFSRVEPQPISDAHTVSVNQNCASQLNLTASATQPARLAAHFGQMQPLPGADPLAMIYAGHQFGVYVPQLGDGRAILLGEVLNNRGERWDIQLKGAGKTPYSRSGDGRAVLRSTIREYLASAALEALGIPTTRALCIIGSSEPVWRETPETAATLVRVARSHIRFGHFEYFHYSDNEKALRALADYVIHRHHPDIAEEKDRYRHLFSRTVAATASLMGQWQAWGFAHGVMNTDNMSILGDTLDFGPYGFMDSYQPDWICNHSDGRGRYAWNRQPSVGLWNCAALAQPFSRLISEDELKSCLENYEQIMTDQWSAIMHRRLGLKEQEDEDTNLFAELLELLHRNHCDYANSFRQLALFEHRQPWCPLGETLSGDKDFDTWAGKYSKRIRREKIPPDMLQQRITSANPCYILRNHLMHLAIDQACRNQGYNEIERLLQLVSSPFEARPGMEEYAAPAPEWSKNLEISCSS